MSDQSVPGDRPRHVVVIGGGLAGLAAAWFLAEQSGTRVTVLEAADRVGGKIHGAEVGGVRVDVGAESMLNRRPEGVGLVRALDLPVVHPEPVSSRLWTRGTLRPLPPSLMGVPFDAEQVRADDVLSAAGLDRMLAERDLPPTPRAERLAAGEDVSVGDLVAERLGDEVVDRLVEPLLGGVYAGHAREISTRAAVPALVAMAGGGSLLTQAAAIPRTSDVPVFAGIRGGVWQLPRALAESGRFEVRTGCTVRSLTRTPTGFRLITGPTTDERPVDADAVVVAAPTAASGRLLADVAPGASTELSAIETASMAVISLAFPVDRAETLDGLGSGFLVPPVDRRRIKAATFSFAKWGWVRAAGDGLLLMRTSIGRHREAAALQADDSELVARSLADLAEATGLDADPVDVRVQRWGGGLPQYAVGHLDRVRRIRDAVTRVDGLAVCGAAYDGVGIPAVIASARAAADRLRTASGGAAQ